MLKKYLYYLRKSDWGLLLLAVILVIFGLMAIYSIEAAADSSEYFNFQKQSIFFGIGMFLLIFFSLLDYRFLKNYSMVLFGLGLVILLAVLVFGTTVRGTRGWLYLLGGQGVQPVEIIKIILIVVVSKFLANWRAEIKTLKQLLIIFTVAGSLIVLVLAQPDLGSAVILIVIFLGMLLMAKVKKAYWAGIVIFLLVVIIASWLFVLQDYQKERVLTFLYPTHDPWGSGYNIKQSIIAVGSGNLFGRGLGLGPQSRLNFLPVQETDFIFAVVAEGLGFIGATLLIIFFVLLIYRIFRIARLARDDFARFLVSGVVIYFLAQTILNIGMNIGLLPIAGVPLPLVSYGGSSLIATLMIIGVIQSIHIRHAGTLP